MYLYPHLGVYMCICVGAQRKDAYVCIFFFNACMCCHCVCLCVAVVCPLVLGYRVSFNSVWVPASLCVFSIV